MNERHGVAHQEWDSNSDFDLKRVAARVQMLAELAVGKYLGGIGQNQEMFFGGLFRHQKNQNVGYRPPIGRVVRNRVFEAQIGSLYPREFFDPGMGNGNSLSQPGRTDLFPAG